jgi:capsular exopolysaccharide synthesis family protein
MSQIFDALQRSEAENAGADSGKLLEANELLKRAELRANSQWEAETTVEGQDLIQMLQGTRFAVREADSAATPAQPVPAAAEAVAGQDIYSRFQSLLVPESSKSQLVSFSNANSPAAEAFRLLGVRLKHLRRERPLKKVLITSSIPEEGKTTVAANLACTFTTRQKTLLLEGDVRRPSLSRMFGLEKKVGLCEWLRGECALTDCIYRLDGPEFWILPAGKNGGNPLELLQSGRLPVLMDQVAGLFEWIVIDSPPVLPLADTSVWTRIADGILLVARQGTTRKKQLKRGLEALEPQKLIGALVNSSKNANTHGYYYASEIQPEDGLSR